METNFHAREIPRNGWKAEGVESTQARLDQKIGPGHTQQACIINKNKLKGQTKVIRLYKLKFIQIYWTWSTLEYLNLKIYYIIEIKVKICLFEN